MLRSLYTGISGVSASNLELDVIGNNIANANTIGFKSSRVTFRDLLSQNMSSGSRPMSTGLGGTNPMQVGLGTSVGSIDTINTQGGFQGTGIKTDLALNGTGFFVLSDGQDSYFTRAGAFGMDSEHYLVDPSSGLRLQGVMADSSGNIMPGSFSDLLIDPNIVMPASASTSVTLNGNLNSSSDGSESILESNHFITAAESADLLTGFYGQDGSSFDLQTNDRIALTGMIEVGGERINISEAPFLVNSENPVDGGETLQQMIDWAITTLESQDGIDPGSVSINIEDNGSLTFQNSSGATIHNLRLSVSGNTAFNNNFTFSSEMPAGSVGTTSDAIEGTGQIRTAANESDCLVDLFDSHGDSLGLHIDETDLETTIEISGTVAGDSISVQSLLVTADTTLSDLTSSIHSTFGIASGSVAIDSDGQIVVTGDVGSDYELGNLQLREVGEVNSVLDSAFDFSQVQEASDSESPIISTTVYDSLGNSHNVVLTFSKTDGSNQWLWSAEMEDGEAITSGGTGSVTFSDTGEIQSFIYDEGASGLTFNPNAEGEEGAASVTISFDAGVAGEINGLTQYSTTSNVIAQSDGFKAGNLIDYEIDEQGIVIGHFSNDTVKTLAQVGIATFANDSGLKNEGGNVFKAGTNSGSINMTFAGTGNNTSMYSGALETSNVDIAEQFTRMVIAQRAFQANAKVITTGDEVLQEIVSMLR
jgi:flagellar hook protein FlgE